MNDPLAVIRALGGVAATGELRRRGFTLANLVAATRSGALTRVRKGWYADPGSPVPVVRAWRVGGRLACVSAAVDHGLWVPESLALHVAVRHSAARLRTPDDSRRRLADHPDDSVIVHWTEHPPDGTRRAVSVSEAVAQVALCQDPRFTFVVLESALRQARGGTFDHHQLLDSLPNGFRRFAARASSQSDSGSESLLKWELLRLKIPFHQQVVVGGLGPVDFLIGDRLVLEVDSREFHSDPYRDRRKDAELGALGYRVLRFMHSQILYEWPVVEAAILAALGRGDAY